MEQPLPPYGACLLGSINLVKFITTNDDGEYILDWGKLALVIEYSYRAMDNVIDRAIYPLPAHEAEAKGKRRMGIGVTGLGNLLSILGLKYGSEECVMYVDMLMQTIAEHMYVNSIYRAKTHGSFPMLDKEEFLKSEFMKSMPWYIHDMIREHGIRNSHLLSIAPTGTISLCADNVSSGLEPTFAKEYERIIQKFDGPSTFIMRDYAWDKYGVCQTVQDGTITADDHVNVLLAATRWVDSACSKTINIGPRETWEDFKNVYIKAYEGGASGCTTYRETGHYDAVLKATKEEITEMQGEACTFDPVTGIRSCE